MLQRKFEKQVFDPPLLDLAHDPVDEIRSFTALKMILIPIVVSIQIIKWIIGRPRMYIITQFGFIIIQPCKTLPGIKWHHI
jgi:hypothetical protein